MKKLDDIRKKLDEKLINILLEVLKPVEEEQSKNINLYWLDKVKEFESSCFTNILAMLENKYNCENYYSRKREYEKQKDYINLNKLNDNYKNIKKDDLYCLYELGYCKTDNETNIRNQILRLDKFIEKQIKFNILNGRYKLFKTVLKYFSGMNVKQVELINANYSIQGLEGTFKVYLDRDFMILNCYAIVAGGYNIQKAHYRYLSKLK